jgi:hypothetical protein
LEAGLTQTGGFNRHRQAGNAGHAPCRSSFRSLVDRALSWRAAELCPALSSTTPTPCESLIDPASDLLQNRINTRLSISGATPDDGASVWAESRQAPFETVGGATALTTTYFGADYRLGSDLLLGAMVQRDDRIVTLPVDGEVTATDAYFGRSLCSLSAVLKSRPRRPGLAGAKSPNGTTPCERGVRLHHHRLLTEARLTGSWGLGEWQLMPAAAVTHLDETAIAAIPGLAGTNLATTRFTAGPEVRRPIDMGIRLEPRALCLLQDELRSR